MKLLITGGLGFIGSNFILRVLEKHPKFAITNIDAELVGSNRQNLKSIQNNKNYSFIKGNITNQRLIEKLVSKNDAVINFAAESHVDRSIANSKPFIDSNIIGMYTILEAIKKYKKKLIQISTDEVFGSLKSGSADEKYPFNPSSPYAASKASSELLAQSYMTTYESDIIITRCTNNYGPRQATEKLIPKVILLALKNKKIPIYGNGKNIRDWIFVTDHCDAILKVLFKGKSGESYNIAGNNESDNITIIKKILKILNKPATLMYHSEDRPGHDFRYSLDSSKISRKLNWRPSHDFESALKNTVNWYLENKIWHKKISQELMNSHPWKT